MNISYIRNNSDAVGILASGLCLVHCLLTPFVFVAHSGITMIEDGQAFWWKSLDLIFLVLSYFAIRRSIRTTSKPSIKYAFWASWLFLVGIIINEKLEVIPLPEEMIYIGSLSLVILHFYNLKYCQCEKECCTTN